MAEAENCLEETCVVVQRLHLRHGSFVRARERSRSVLPLDQLEYRGSFRVRNCTDYSDRAVTMAETSKPEERKYDFVTIQLEGRKSENSNLTFAFSSLYSPPVEEKRERPAH